MIGTISVSCIGWKTWVLADLSLCWKYILYNLNVISFPGRTSSNIQTSRVSEISNYVSPQLWGDLLFLLSPSVRLVVHPLSNQVCAQYLENHLSQSLHISHGDWSLWGHDPYWFWVQVKGQGHIVRLCKIGFLSISWEPFITEPSYFTWWLVFMRIWSLLTLVQ